MPEATLLRRTAFILALVAGSASHAQTAQVGVAGTLSCVTSETPAGATADAELSCRFHAASGRDSNFKGFMARKGQADIPPGKRVLVWSVLTAKTDFAPEALAGRYSGQTGGTARDARLTGGAENSVVLLPVASPSQSGESPAPTVLDLRLEPVRA